MKTVQRYFSIIVGLFFIGIFCAVGSVYFFRPQPPMRTLLELDTLKSLQFVGASHNVIKDFQLEGKLNVINFFFTRCAGPCPLMSRELGKLQSEFGAEKRFQILSATLDPGHDTPAVLREYASKYGAKPGLWAFATGVKEEMVRFAREMLKLSAGDDPSMHSTKFVLVNGRSEIKGYYDSQNQADLDRLRRDIRSSL